MRRRMQQEPAPAIVPKSPACRHDRHADCKWFERVLVATTPEIQAPRIYWCGCECHDQPPHDAAAELAAKPDPDTLIA